MTNLSDFMRRLTRGMAAESLGDHSDRQLVERAFTGQDETAGMVEAMFFRKRKMAPILFLAIGGMAGK